MKKKLKLSTLIAWNIFVIFSSTTPVVPAVFISFSYADKFWHFLLYLVLAMLWYMNLGIIKNKTYLIFVVSFFFSLIIEVLQIFLPYRSFSFFDLVSNATGIIVGIVIMKYIYFFKKPKLLLHICCISCGAYVSQILQADYRVTLFFYNPNIFPENEYLKRLNTTREIAKILKIKLITNKYDHNQWLNKIHGYEQELERGRRCKICYQDRMERAAKFASQNNFDYFATTLSVSPHKNSDAISRIGGILSSEYKIKYLDKNFKKNDGFKKSVLLSQKLNLYRQNYCGCEFSFRPIAAK